MSESFIVEKVEIDDQFYLPDDSVSSMATERNKCTAKPNDDIQLQKFLQTIEMESAYGYLKAAQVTYRSLPYLRKEDLKEALPPLGLRVEFREKLFMWKKTILGIDDESMPITLKFGEWSKRCESIPNQPEAISSSRGRLLSMDLKVLLNSSPKGRSVLDYASRNPKLMTTHRDDIINIIIEDIINQNIKLCTQDYNCLLEEIYSVFPAERNMQDYYYIPRKGKNNASGKLYSRYKNKNQKRKRLLISLPNTSADESPVSSDKEVGNESVAVALKTSLMRDCDNWETVCEKWERTYHMRQKDLKKYNSSDFLQEWPKLSDPRAMDLIKIDFHTMYPAKGHLLLTKWDKFKRTVRKFYADNIHNEYCRQLFTSASTLSNIDSEDYIYTILLNAVLPSPARFGCPSGKRMKKATIMDSQESFVLRLVTLDDYKSQIDSVFEKYHFAGLTVQPLLIVEGMSDVDIVGFYIFFNNNLIKLHSFIECLDICFKIFQTLSLKYPEACQQPWIFIQKFFYEINTVNDSKSASVASLINFCCDN